MAHGLPDAANVKSVVPSFNLQDLGELGARLGSPVRYDRSGIYLYMNDFSAGLAGIGYSLSVSGAYACADPEYSMLNGISIYLHVDADPDDFAQLFDYVGGIEAGILALGTFLSVATDSYGFKVTIYHYNGSVRREYSIRYVSTTDVLQVLESDGSYTTFETGVELDQSQYQFTYYKLKIDTEDNAYVSLTVDQTIYSLAAYAPQASASSVPPRIASYIEPLVSLSLDATINVDALFLVQGE